MKRRKSGRLRKLTPQERAKRRAHNERTDRKGKIWSKKHIVGSAGSARSGGHRPTESRARTAEVKSNDWVPSLYGGVRK